MLDAKSVMERLEGIGYEARAGDDSALAFCIEKVRNTIRNEVNTEDMPEGLEHIAADMAAGEFLLAKKTFSPGDLSSIDLSAAVKQIQTGDTNTVFGTGESTLTPEQRLDYFIQHLLTCGQGQFAAFRRIKW